jgi:hypothetical protein
MLLHILSKHKYTEIFGLSIQHLYLTAKNAKDIRKERKDVSLCILSTYFASFAVKGFPKVKKGCLIEAPFC